MINWDGGVAIRFVTKLAHAASRDNNLIDIYSRLGAIQVFLG